METKLDFNGLGQILLGRIGEHVVNWLPGGRIIGHEYVCGDIRGGPGDSMKVNMNTGKWADFAGDIKGGDLISLFAAVENIKQGEAAKRLAEQVGFRLKDDPPARAPAAAEHQLGRPPEGTGPNMDHPKFGQPSASWLYEDTEGRLFYVARYQTAQGKQFCPWSWSISAKRWVAKGWPAPRPLYGLKGLAEKPGKPVMIVEGEKAADAAQSIVGDTYAVVSWPNGAKAVERSSWDALKGRKCLIWPDADDPGIAAAKTLADILLPICPEVKVIDTQGRPESWDAADAVAEKWAYKQFFDWAKPRAALVVKAEARAGEATATAQINLTINLDDTPSSGNHVALWDEIGIACNQQGSPFANVDNARRVLEKWKPLRGIVWFDEFHQKFYTTWNSKSPRIWQDVDDINLATYIQRNLGLAKISVETAHQAARSHGRLNVRNEPREWMEGLKWDGQRRIHNFLENCFGATFNEYTHTASKNFWVGIAARIFNAGCKLDNMLVLEGPQGTFKSSALEIIGGKWYLEMKESVQSKDFFQCLHGKLVVEIAELDSFSRADVTRIKQVISSRTDSYRAPYERAPGDHPRMSIFVGTTNEQSYLRDSTGGRRFWPILCRTVNLEKIAADRDMLFAEAVHELRAGANWWEMPKAETEQEQESRRLHDEWEGAIYEWCAGKTQVTIREIAINCLGSSLEKLDKNVQLRIGFILRKQGWLKGGQGWDKVWSRSIQEEFPPA